MKRADDPRIPLTSQLFGFGPMLPLVAAAVGAWSGPGEWPYRAVRLAIVWAALVLAFVGGVRRGFGFGQERGLASAGAAATVVAAALYLFAALAALVAPSAAAALAILVAGYVLAALLDGRAAIRGNAPRHFARLRPPQLLLGAAALAATWAWVRQLGGG